MSDNIDTNTNTNIKRPLIKEEIVDYGEKTQQTDVGYSRTKTKVETKSSQKNKKEKDWIMKYGFTASTAKSKEREVVKVALLVVEVFNFLCFAIMLKKIVDSYISSGPRCRHAMQYKYHPFIP